MLSFPISPLASLPAEGDTCRPHCIKIPWTSLWPARGVVSGFDFEVFPCWCLVFDFFFSSHLFVHLFWLHDVPYCLNVPYLDVCPLVCTVAFSIGYIFGVVFFACFPCFSLLFVLPCNFPSIVPCRLPCDFVRLDPSVQRSMLILCSKMEERFWNYKITTKFTTWVYSTFFLHIFIQYYVNLQKRWENLGQNECWKINECSLVIF